MRSSGPVRVPQVHTWCHPVSHELLEFLRLRETSLLGARPDQCPAHAYFEDTSGARYERDLVQTHLERRQQLLSQPCRSEKPAALRAVSNFDSRHRRFIRSTDGLALLHGPYRQPCQIATLAPEDDARTVRDHHEYYIDEGADPIGVYRQRQPTWKPSC